MANDLVQCKNDQSGFKEQIQDLKAEVARLKIAADWTVHTDAIDVVKGQPEVKHVEGNLPPDQISKVVRASAGTLRACYEKGLKHNPNLQTISSVKARFSIRNTGHAEGIGIAPHVDAEMEKCMGQAIGKWKFPEFTGEPIAVETPVNLVAK